MLVKRSNKRSSEIFPIAFLCLAFASGLILPFILGKEYSKIFCVTITVALFVYYVFLILQMTEKDALTGLLNRQSFYASTGNDSKDINALVTIDMNGLKAINDLEGAYSRRYGFGNSCILLYAGIYIEGFCLQNRWR